MENRATKTLAWSASTRSRSASSGDFPISAATCESRFPVHLRSSGFITEMMRMSFGGRPFHPFPSPRAPSRISLRIRARSFGSWKRSIIRGTPPSWAHCGTVLSRPFPLAT